MAERIDYAAAGELLRGGEDIYILCHQSPDGDTLGCGFGLWNILHDMGKRARVLCHDKIPKKFEFLTAGYSDCEFAPKMIVAVDIADTGLFGERLSEYRDRVELCIDHHVSNSGYAKKLLLESDSAAACEIIYFMAKHCSLPVSDMTAKCLYTGIATDTGCFKFENTTARTHRAVAELMSYPLGYAKLNRYLFDIKSKARLDAEREAMGGLELYFDGKCSLVTITSDMGRGLQPSDYDGIASLPMCVDGVEVGITIKQRSEDTYKISMRSAERVNVSAVCGEFGGGGHIRAAGCTMQGELCDIKRALVDAVGRAL